MCEIVIGQIAGTDLCILSVGFHMELDIPLDIGLSQWKTSWGAVCSSKKYLYSPGSS